ncbi:D-ribose pyranase [Tolumonas lignilytica]|jgi:ABC-type ribose transport system, auxiliary component|uniref:D-ribose pyranase n=1 Tax=Tolumonas lignilytica TaxID=1283284 RepID=UPI000466C094|nr:D-ribose pyranase [Tolumonas lignilytica]
MKKHVLLNAPLSHVIATMGHTDQLVVCDAGLPIPAAPERIDLAVSRGVPKFMDVVQAVTAEMQIEQVILTHEFAEVSPALHIELVAHLEHLAEEQGHTITFEYVSHEEFKELTHLGRAVVRTGECTPYANVIFVSGVVF